MDSHLESHALNKIVHEEPYIRLRKFAALCGSTVFTVRRWLKDNPDIPRRQTPSGIVVRFSEVMDWFDKHLPEHQEEVKMVRVQNLKRKESAS